MDANNPTPAGWYPDPNSSNAESRRWWDGTVWTAHVSTEPDQRPPVRRSKGSDETESAADANISKPPDFGLRLTSHIFEATTIILAFFNVSVVLIALGSLVALATLSIEIAVLARFRRRGELTAGRVFSHLLVGTLGVVWFAIIWIHGISLFLGQQ
jgi:hypothetical protein